MTSRLLPALAIVCLALLGLTAAAHAQDADGKKVRLFLLSGQSNMVGIEPDEVFTPAVKKAFPDDEVIVVKFAKGGRPIRNWVKAWKSTKPDDKAKGNLSFYKALTSEAEKALEALLAQLQETYGRQDIDFVLGRLSDHGVGNADFPDWEQVREAQVTFAEADPAHRAWIDTDNYNETGDGLHYDKDGRSKLADRFAEESIRLIQN